MRVHRHFPTHQQRFLAWLCATLVVGALGVEFLHHHTVAQAPGGRSEHACQAGDSHRWSAGQNSSVRAPSNQPCTACRYRGGPANPANLALLGSAPPGVEPLSRLLSPLPLSGSHALGFLDRAPPA